MDIRVIDFTLPVRAFDYTKKSVMRLREIVTSRQFAEKDSDAIYAYLCDTMEMISFKDYLKRYIYKMADIELPFESVSEDVYMDIIMGCFEEHQCPRSLVPNTRRWRSTVREWLQQDAVSRSTLFLLGFGLGMSDADVSEFLLKVLKDEDFDFTNIQEAIYWHCYHHQLPYAKAAQMLQDIESADEAQMAGAEDFSTQLLAAIFDNPRIYLSNEEMLKPYLLYLKHHQLHSADREDAYRIFCRLYDEVRAAIITYYARDWDNHKAESKRADQVTAGEVEKILYSGIPYSNSGNLERISASALPKVVMSRRLTRQRINQVLHRQKKVSRYDLITLMFIKYALTSEVDAQEAVYLDYIDEVNRVLMEARCYVINPVNPYEALVLMCLLTEYPLQVYGEVWENAYNAQ